MAVFYQTYRPQKFSEVIGQDSIVQALKQAAASGKLGHAYLFTGSRGIGKTTIARILAKAANCTALKEGDPCGKCSACVAISQGSFLDCIEIDAASHTGVDNIRELIDRIAFQPSQGRTKVFIIDEVHMLSKAAFNALLKTLEEPPAHVMFVLATTDIEKVPATIVSRTQRFDFRKITPDQIKQALKAIVKKEKLELPDHALDIIVENSEGGLRDALSQLSMIMHLSKEVIADDVHLLLGTTSQAVVEELMGYIAASQTDQLPEFYRKQTELNFDASSFARKVLTYLQQLLEAKLTNKAVDNQDLQQAFALPQLLYIIRLFLRAYKEIDRSLSPDLPLLLASIEAALYMSGNSNTPTSGTNRSQPQAQNPTIISKSEVIELAPVLSALVAEEAETELISKVNSDVNLSIEQVSGWWLEMVEEVRKVNSPLATLLKNCPLHEVKGNRVSVAVKYLFHQEHLENSKHRAQINQVLSQKAGQTIEFRVVLVKDSVGEKITDTAAAVSDALRIFGGELIE